LGIYSICKLIGIFGIQFVGTVNIVVVGKFMWNKLCQIFIVVFWYYAILDPCNHGRKTGLVWPVSRIEDLLLRSSEVNLKCSTPYQLASKKTFQFNFNKVHRKSFKANKNSHQNSNFIANLQRKVFEVKLLINVTEQTNLKFLTQLLNWKFQEKEWKISLEMLFYYWKLPWML
jgi:hypothetical protein